MYDKKDLELRNRTAYNTICYIDGQLKILNEQLLQAEDSLISFKRKYRIFNSEISTSVSEEFVKQEEEIKEYALQEASLLDMDEKLTHIARGDNIILPLLFALTDSRLTSGIEHMNQQVIEREILV